MLHTYFQKIAQEQELLDRERGEVKRKHGEHKSKWRQYERGSDNDPPAQMPGNMWNNGRGGVANGLGSYSNMMSELEL